MSDLKAKLEPHVQDFIRKISETAQSHGMAVRSVEFGPAESGGTSGPCPPGYCWRPYTDPTTGATGWRCVPC